MLRKLEKHWGHDKSASMQNEGQLAFNVLPGLEKYKEDFDKNQQLAPQSMPDMAVVGDGKIVHKTPFAKYLVGKYSPQEEVSQKVFNAAGLGDYHQKSFNTSYQDKELHPDSGKNIVTVSVIEPNFVTLDLGDHDYNNDTWFKLAIIDAALGHADRKDADVLVSRDNGAPLLVNNGIFSEPADDIAKKAAEYTYLPNVANRQAIIDQLMNEWWPTVQALVSAILGTKLEKHQGHDYINQTSNYHSDRGKGFNDIPHSQLSTHSANLYAEKQHNPLHEKLKTEFDSNQQTNLPEKRTGIALEGVNRKAIHKIGDNKYMVKPYSSHEGLSQKVFHAVGLGHLHQKSFTSNYSEDGKTNPATVIHIEPHYRVLGEHEDDLDVPIGGQNGEFEGDYAKINLLDGVLGQGDRHKNNIMFHKVNGQPLAIDNESLGWDVMPITGQFSPIDRLAIHMHDNSVLPMDDDSAREAIDKHIRPWWPTVANKIIEASAHHHLGEKIKRNVEFINKALELKKDEDLKASLFQPRQVQQKETARLSNPPTTPKNISVIHNTSEDKLHYIHDAHEGFIPGPSFAIKHKDRPFDGFGQITLIAHPSLIDPQKPHVHVFNQDAFTPRAPRSSWVGGSSIKLNKLTGLMVAGDIDIPPSQTYKYSSTAANKFYDENPHLDRSQRHHLYQFTKWLGDKYRQAGYNRVTHGVNEAVREMKKLPIVGGEEPDGALVKDIYKIRRLKTLGEVKEAGDRTNYDYRNPGWRFDKQHDLLDEFGIPHSKELDVIAEVNNHGTPVEEAVDKHLGDGLKRNIWAVLAGPKNPKHNARTPEENKKAIVEHFEHVIDQHAKKPAPYMEGKILRPVHLSEFHTAVVPDDISPEYADLLENKYGLNVVKYKKGSEDSRLKTVHDESVKNDLLLNERDEYEKLLLKAKDLIKKLNEQPEQPEQTQPEKNLVVFHNTRPEKLHYFEDAHNGYIPGPSIGISHKDQKVGGFGNVTLIAHPKLIDPAKPYVHVFNQDAFTPTDNHGHRWVGGDKEKLQQSLGHGFYSVDANPSSILKEELANDEGSVVNKFYKENPRLKKPDRNKHLYQFTKWLGKKYRDAGFTRAKSTNQIIHYMQNRPLIGGEEGAEGDNNYYETRKLNSFEEIKRYGQRTAPDAKVTLLQRDTLKPYPHRVKNREIVEAITDVNNNNTPVEEATKYLVRRHALTDEEKNSLNEHVKQVADIAANNPTLFLEAKILRPVHLSEFHTAVVPKNMSPAHVKHLKDKYGLNVVKYDDDVGDYKEQRHKATQDAAMTHDLMLGEKPTYILPLKKSTADLLETVQNAFKAGDVYSTDQQKDERLVGKHTHGTLVAHDKSTGESVMLKPGSGPQNATAGATDTSASQTNREAAFYNIAKAMGLGGFLPEVRVMNLHGQSYAAIHMLPLDKYRDMNQVGKYVAKRVFSKYPLEVYKWAAMDYILGNADRNAGNVMTDGIDVKLIDHGSAFGGANFAPIKDQKSFVPYYLRINEPARLTQAQASSFAEWLQAIPVDKIKQIATSYGIDPSALVDRLTYLKRDEEPHEGVLMAWGV